MKTHILWIALAVIGMSSTTFAQSADREYVSNLKKFQQVCKGKSAGSEVNFAHKGVIWNGTCEHLFTANTASVNTTDSEQIAYKTCQQDAQSATMQIDGKDVKGKCVLTYTPPMPKE